METWIDDEPVLCITLTRDEARIVRYEPGHDGAPMTRALRLAIGRAMDRWEEEVPF